ncbi:MAG: FMN-binding protein [Oscillospiraceae bacterium]|nr:FMN-binding protein [Oscillospiraceae bacterium]
MKNKISFKKLLLARGSAKLSDNQKKEILASVIVISAILIIATLLLGVVANLLGGIAERNAKAYVFDAMERVMPAENYEKSEMQFDAATRIKSLYEAKNGDQLVGYCVETEANGYKNPIRIVVGVDASGAVTKVEVLSIAETSGYNSKIKDEDFLSSFSGKNEELTVVTGKADTSAKIAAVSGATVSSNGVKEGVNHAIAAVSQIRAEAEQKRLEEEKLQKEKEEQARLEAEKAAASENAEAEEAAE